jgi:hypothetical protein
MASRPTRGTNFRLTACSVIQAIQQCLGAASHELPVEAAIPVRVGDFTDRLRSKFQQVSYLRSGHTLGETQQGNPCNSTRTC